MSRAPEPTTAELRRWALLATRALVCAEQVGLATGDLAEAARLARKSCVPGRLSHDNAFVKLQRTAARFCGSTTAQRRDQAADLKALAEECHLILSAMAKTGHAAPAGRHPGHADD